MDVTLPTVDVWLVVLAHRSDVLHFATRDLRSGSFVCQRCQSRRFGDGCLVCMLAGDAFFERPLLLSARSYRSGAATMLACATLLERVISLGICVSPDCTTYMPVICFNWNGILMYAYMVAMCLCICTLSLFAYFLFLQAALVIAMGLVGRPHNCCMWLGFWEWDFGACYWVAEAVCAGLLACLVLFCQYIGHYIGCRVLVSSGMAVHFCWRGAWKAVLIGVA